jgi:2-keto-3-deoxy-L-rhamnonate aldolase RhmA
MKENKLKAALRARGSAAGHMIMEFGTRGLAKILPAQQLDFLLLDMEHTGFDTERVADVIAWLKATDIAPIVRVPQPLYHFLARIMDAGALGVMVANVESAEQAKKIVGAVKYAPIGFRGVALGVAHNDFVLPDPKTYYEYSNQNTSVITMIESPAGLENAEAIAAEPGVDILWVGHYDLSTAMGIPGEFQHPRFLEALRHVAASAKKYGKDAGMQPGNTDQAKQWHSLGYNVLSWRSDIATYQIALREGLSGLQAILDGKEEVKS